MNAHACAAEHRADNDKLATLAYALTLGAERVSEDTVRWVNGYIAVEAILWGNMHIYAKDRLHKNTMLLLFRPTQRELRSLLLALRVPIAEKEAVPVGGFVVGESVSKVGGDYRFDGVVVARFKKLSGAERYVVEDDRGVLHIYSEKNLKKRESATMPE